jgi:hypothetical protein
VGDQHARAAHGYGGATSLLASPAAPNRARNAMRLKLKHKLLTINSPGLSHEALQCIYVSDLFPYRGWRGGGGDTPRLAMVVMVVVCMQLARWNHHKTLSKAASEMVARRDGKKVGKGLGGQDGSSVLAGRPV